MHSLSGLFIFLPEADGEDGAASHGKPQEDGSEKGHQGKSGSHGGKCVRSEKPADDQRVGDIIALLQQVAQDHGEWRSAGMVFMTGPWVSSFCISVTQLSRSFVNNEIYDNSGIKECQH